MSNRPLGFKDIRWRYLYSPLLTQESYDELATFFTLIGGSYRNPIDTGNVNRLQLRRIMEILEKDTNTDNLVLLTSIGAFSRMRAQVEGDIQMLIEIRKRTPKPVLVTLGFSAPEAWQETREVMEKLREGGIPTFATLERGARALKNALDYYTLKKSVNA